MSNELVNIQQNLATELVSAKAILPPHVSFDRFTNAAAVALANSRDLLEADRQSVINSLTTCAKDGLIPDGREAALVIYKNKRPNGEWVKIAQYIPMIDGVMKRARQSGEISIIAARVVYANDKFRAWMDDSGEHITYEPTLAERGSAIGVFAYVRMKSSEVQFEWMNLSDIEKVKKASKTSDKGPWVDWWEGMWRKSALHRLCRRLPNSSELIEMLERGNEMNWQNTEKDITPNIASSPAFSASSVNSLINGRTEELPQGEFTMLPESIQQIEDLLWQMEGAQSMDELRGIAEKIRAIPKDAATHESAMSKYQEVRSRIDPSTGNSEE